MHLLLGHSWDSCCAGVLARLEARGLPARIVPAPLTAAGAARLAPRRGRARQPPQLGRPGSRARRRAGRVGPAGSIPPAGIPADHAYMQAEMLAATLAWLAGLPCPVINRPSAALWYRGRASLMTWRRLLRSYGLPVPEQLVTNDPGEARDFGHRLAALGVAGAVYTPLTGETGYLLATDAAWQGLAALQARAPVCLSEPHGAAAAGMHHRRADRLGLRPAARGPCARASPVPARRRRRARLPRGRPRHHSAAASRW